MPKSKEKFPGFAKCMELMRKHNPALQEEGFFALQPHAHEYVPELIAEFRREPEHGLRCWLLELIAYAKSEEAFPVLVEALQGEDDSFWSYAVSGLKKLETKEARRVLWEARSYTKSSDEATQDFLRNCLKRSTGKTTKHETGHGDVDESLAALG